MTKLRRTTRRPGQTCTLTFKLDAGGESILLSAPDGTLIDRVDFGQQSPDKTMGRSGDEEIVALATPSPVAANGVGGD